MKKGLTELVFIIDRSGSMNGLEGDTIGGFNAMLKEQQAVEDEALVTTVLFDDEYELLHDRIDIRAVAPLTDKDYTVRGSTALLDAVGKTVRKIRGAQKHTAEDYRAEKVMFVIITDGMENASCQYFAEEIRRQIEHQKQKHGWEFVFFGANMDAIAEAGKLGIAADRAQNYRPRIQDPGSTRPLHFHGLRHTCAAEWYQEFLAQGLEEKQARLKVAKLLEHGRISVTKIYTASVKANPKGGGTDGC